MYLLNETIHYNWAIKKYSTRYLYPVKATFFSEIIKFFIYYLRNDYLKQNVLLLIIPPDPPDRKIGVWYFEFVSAKCSNVPQTIPGHKRCTSILFTAILIYDFQ